MDPDSAAEWIPRTRGFLEALRGGEPNLFAPDIHPGVTLMWLTAAGLGLWRVIGSCLAALDPVEAFTWVVKMPVALMTSLLAVVAWAYLRRLLDRGTAVLVAGLFALDPLYLVFSRYLHLDALVTGFIFSGLLATWYGLTTARVRSVAMGAVLLDLGALTRFNGLVAIMVALACFAWWSGKTGRTKALAVFLLAGLATTVVIWPAVVFSPAGIMNLLNNRIGLALVAHEVPPNVDVIPWVRAMLYPIFIVTREFPLLLLAGLVGLGTLWRGRAAVHRLGRLLVVFSVLYYVSLWLAPKDLDRYILPVIGPLAVLAGLGLKWIWTRRPWPAVRWVLVGLVIVQFGMFYRLGPYFQTYQNGVTALLRQTPLRTSQALDPAWGEGISEAMAYLKLGRMSLPHTAAWYAGVVCYYGHDHVSTNYPLSGNSRLDCPAGLRLLATPREADYLVLSRDQIAQRVYPKLLDDIERLDWSPTKTISINGVPMIFIYANRGGLADRYTLRGDE